MNTRRTDYHMAHKHHQGANPSTMTILRHSDFRVVPSVPMFNASEHCNSFSAVSVLFLFDLKLVQSEP